MSFEELNIVRTLKKKISDEEQKLQGFKDLAQSITPQFSRTTCREGKKEISYTCLDVQPKGNSSDSRIEKIIPLIIDTEKIIADLKERLKIETSLLIEKINANFTGIEHRILFGHYVNGKSFREIALTSHYTLRHIFRVHDRLKKELKNVI